MFIYLVTQATLLSFQYVMVLLFGQRILVVVRNARNGAYIENLYIRLLGLFFGLLSLGLTLVFMPIYGLLQGIDWYIVGGVLVASVFVLLVGFTVMLGLERELSVYVAQWEEAKAQGKHTPHPPFAIQLHSWFAFSGLLLLELNLYIQMIKHKDEALFHFGLGLLLLVAYLLLQQKIILLRVGRKRVHWENRQKGV